MNKTWFDKRGKIRKSACKLWIWIWIETGMKLVELLKNKWRVGTHPLKIGFPSKVVTEAGRP